MKLFVTVVIGFMTFGSFGQTKADSLRGGYRDGRNWWDLKHYDLSVSFDTDKKTISGKNEITFNIIAFPEKETFQLDLQDPMILDSVVLYTNNKYYGKLELKERVGSAYLFKYNKDWLNKFSKQASVIAYFHGSPTVAVKPPWDGGIIWKTANGLPWVSVACQGLGASVWFPNKDSQADEPDSVIERFTCPSNLVCVGNGRLSSKKNHENGQTTYTWKVTNPINNYNIIPYVGDYVELHDSHKGERGVLNMDYWVIRGNEERAKAHFKDANRTIEALEYWFGPYPFYEDSYKLVEAPHLGMEHQSAVAYGNKYMKGYMGSDLSGTGVGLQWDFIIVHESGHEWYGNNITTKDIADMWVHEGFTNYSEVLFTEYWYGKDQANEYCRGLRKNIKNDKPIIGPYGLNEEGSGDMYYKGSNMIHTIRQLMDNDSVFRQMLRDMNQSFYHETVNTEQIEQFMGKYCKEDLKKIFDQYLRDKRVPVLCIKYKKGKMKYRWTKCIEGFNMPVLTSIGSLASTTEWTVIDIRSRVPELNRNQYYLLKEKGKKNK